MKHEEFVEHMDIRLGEVRRAMGRLRERNKSIQDIYLWVDRLYRDVTEQKRLITEREVAERS